MTHIRDMTEQLLSLITVRTTFFLFNWRLTYHIFESLTFSIKCGLNFFHQINVKRINHLSSILCLKGIRGLCIRSAFDEIIHLIHIILISVEINSIFKLLLGQNWRFRSKLALLVRNVKF